MVKTVPFSNCAGPAFAIEKARYTVNGDCDKNMNKSLLQKTISPIGFFATQIPDWLYSGQSKCRQQAAAMPIGNKKLLTSKSCYVFIRSMHAQSKYQSQVANPVFNGLNLRALNLLALASLLGLLILSQGVGSG